MPEPIDIRQLQSLQPTGSASPMGANKPAETGQAGQGSFADVLRETLEKVNELQAQSGDAVEKLATGETKNLADVMVAVENAGVAFQFTMQVRNKIVEAYQEMMRMQI